MNLERLIADQQKVSALVKISPLRKNVTTIAGADVAQRLGWLCAAVVVCSFPEMEILEENHFRARAAMPYVPGFLSYRELPVLVRAHRGLKRKPSLILVDGQGIAHPRGLGLASHLGVVLHVPSIGCAKSHLYGKYTEPGVRRGAYRYVRCGSAKIGLVLRTRDDVRPLFVSPGHLVDLRDCLHFILSTARKYRIPEPLRMAHKSAGLWAKYE